VGVGFARAQRYGGDAVGVQPVGVEPAELSLEDGLERERLGVGKFVRRGAMAGDVAFPGNFAAFAHGFHGFISVELPEARRLTGVQLRGQVNHASPTCELKVRVSTDGKTYTTVRELKDYVAARDVAPWVDLGGQEVRALRVEFEANRKDPRNRYPGLSSLRPFKGTP